MFTNAIRIWSAVASRKYSLQFVALICFLSIILTGHLTGFSYTLTNAIFKLPHPAANLTLYNDAIAFPLSTSAERKQNVWRDLIATLDGMRGANSTCQQTSFATIVQNNTNIVSFMRLYRTAAAAELNFLQFTAVISAERFMQPDAIVFWSNIEPHGFYYELLKLHTNCLKWQHVELLAAIANKTVQHIEHAVDFQKLQLLYAFGGTVLDFDVAFVNGTAFREAARGYECLTGCESDCSLISIGIAACPKPQSEFVRLWLKGYFDDYRPEAWGYNSNLYSTALLNKNKYNRSLIRLDDRITQRPQWDEKNDWLMPAGVKDWQTKPITHHYWKLAELQTATNVTDDYELLLMTNSFGQLLRHVYGVSLTSAISG